MLDNTLLQEPLRMAMTNAYRINETDIVSQLSEMACLSPEQQTRVAKEARDLVVQIRQKRLGKGGIDAFMYQYDLSNDEGIALMCLAEALLRIPDKATADKLIKDKVQTADWQVHAGKSDSLFVNAATWGLMLTGHVYQWNELKPESLARSLKKIAGKSGEPVIRKAVNYAMSILGKQFVMGRTIEESVKRARELEAKNYRYSYDMLGEAARTAADAKRYFESYQTAIEAIGRAAKHQGPISGPGISVKLSALHPRYEYIKYETVIDELVPLVLQLAEQAKSWKLGLTIDAEEADRLDLALDIFERVYTQPSLEGWEGFGLALQSYQKRGFSQIDWLINLSRRHKRKIMLRLIKGAYWDSEIKASQEQGLDGYPVFTRKTSTDVSFVACAKKILAAGDVFYPQFATHNAYTVATILELAKGRTDFEFQCLHGMGQTLYDEIVGADKKGIACRIYAPVGSHEDLLAYLVRRLLENGANSSFVNRIVDESAPIEQLIADPVIQTMALTEKPHPNIPLPENIYGPHRKNAKGIDLSNRQVFAELKQDMDAHASNAWQAAPIIDGQMFKGSFQKILSPINGRLIGEVCNATLEQVEQALKLAHAANTDWDDTPVSARADCLRKMADLLEDKQAMFMAIAIYEAGKTIPDALSEVREAIDFCRYYANQAEQLMLEPLTLPGPTGELNQLELKARGTIVCISPWNFPLAIFLGQVCAALVTGNTVIAKPAEQTPIIATAAVKLLHEAGIPQAVIQLLPGYGETIGAALVNDERVKGVMFTGSTETARLINQTLANRKGAIVPLIAETGGQNAMLVDSSALPEQVVSDVVVSAFGSAGQRCSALRVLFIQNDVADKIIEMLVGAMAELSVGDPSLLATDVGPVIDKDAQQLLLQHCTQMQCKSKKLFQVHLDDSCQQGYFVAPCAFEIDRLEQLTHEVFGPCLHVIRYNAGELDAVISSINNTGYGLTLGIHSRIDDIVEYIRQRVNVGNTYVNRAMTGAVVGVQPFGGEGLSGTGPKAGGPHYLQRLCNERTLSVDTTAAGGNATLMSLT